MITSSYQTTQSSWFNGAIDFLNGIGSLKDNAIVNFLTAGIGGTVGKWASDISSFMMQIKQTISILYTLMAITIPAMLVAVIIAVIGGFVASRPEKQFHPTEIQREIKKGKSCPSCGAKILKGDKFCPDCGKNI